MTRDVLVWVWRGRNPSGAIHPRDWVTLRALVLEVDPDRPVLELGCGLSTRLLARLGRAVVSVEHDPEWIAAVGGIDNVTPILTDIVDGGYDFSLVPHIDYGVVFIDGPPESIGRQGALRAIAILDGAEYIVIDDADRKAEQYLAEEIASRLQRSLIFSGQLAIIPQSVNAPLPRLRPRRPPARPA